MTQEETNALIAQVKVQVKAELDANREANKAIFDEIVKQKGLATQEQYDQIQKTNEEFQQKIDGILEKQGLTLADIQEKMSTGSATIKTIEDVLKEHEAELRQIASRGNGVKEFMLSYTPKGEIIFQPFNRMASKAPGPTGTVDNLGGGNLSSVLQNISESQILRMGANSQIIDNYANNAWIFELVNTTTADFYTSHLATYWEELPREGSPANVSEGGTKPLVQYRYALRSHSYKKAAQLLQFTEEFNIDFRKLSDDIMGKGRRDLRNFINGEVLTDIVNQATLYNTADEFTAGSQPIQNVNNYDAIAAMAAQVDNATFGNMANAALMSTFQKYRMGIEKSTVGDYINRPSVIDPIRFVGNPSMGADDVVVGDLKQYNVIMRGGLIVRVGHNGTDFAENKFSVVMEQFYWNYISAARKSAIVKGATFAAVKAAIGS